jgi:hypothetical protein
MLNAFRKRALNGQMRLVCVDENSSFLGFVIVDRFEWGDLRIRERAVIGMPLVGQHWQPIGSNSHGIDPMTWVNRHDTEFRVDVLDSDAEFRSGHVETWD